MIVQRECILEYVRDRKKAHRAYECSSSEEYEDIPYLLLTNSLLALLWTPQN